MKKPIKRISPKKRREVKKNPIKKHSLHDASEQKLLSQLKEKINGTMAKAFIAKEHAKSARDKNKFQKIISECRKKLKKLI